MSGITESGIAVIITSTCVGLASLIATIVRCKCGTCECVTRNHPTENDNLDSRINKIATVLEKIKVSLSPRNRNNHNNVEQTPNENNNEIKRPIITNNVDIIEKPVITDDKDIEIENHKKPKALKKSYSSPY